MKGVKNRKRLKNTVGRRKWKKGHSSSSNPEAQTHRKQAKNRFFTVNTGPSSLTIHALKQHNATQGDKDSDIISSASWEGMDTQTVSAKTFNTWATNWTECTNVSFNKVHANLNAGSAMQKEILAVLAAVTEVIKMQGGKETETEYFAALMTSLTTVDTEESKGAVAYLLSLVIKRLPAPVLCKSFPEVSKTLLDTLAAHIDTEAPTLLRSVLICLATLLRHQEQAVWNNSSTLHVYNGILACITHPKPKVRKAALHAVLAILRGSTFMTQPNPPPHHPAASATAKHCIKQLEETGGLGENTTTMHILGLMKEVLGILPQHSLKSACETILRIMTLSSVLVRSVSMQALHGMFNSKPKPSCLPAELNAQIITALYDFQPGENDVQLTGTWLVVMEAAHVNLSRVKSELCISHLPRFVSTCMTCLQSDKTQITQAAAKTLCRLLPDCLEDCTERLGSGLAQAPQGSHQPVHKIVQSIEGGLSYQYQRSWVLVLGVFKVMFKVLGKDCQKIFGQCLLSLANLRESHRFAHKVELDAAVGMAVRTMGPEFVLNSIPLHITGEDSDDLDLPRSWLLPVLRDNVQDTELRVFSSYFLPLANKLYARSMEVSKMGELIKAKTFDALQLQIWSLLPGFCTRPTDLKQSFKSIAKILGSALNDRPDLRLDILASLRKLISHNLDNGENRAELAKFAKNYMPILFNLFTSEPEKERDPQRMAILETIKVYVQIADQQLVCTFFDKCYMKISESEISVFRRHALLDLSIALIAYVDSERLKAMFPILVKQLENSDRTVQKKAYRILETVCSSQSECCQDFVKTHLHQLKDKLITSLSTSQPSAKAPRLRCLIHIFKQLEKPQMGFLKAVVPEAVLCVKEVASKARSAALCLLTQMGNSVITWYPQQHRRDVVRQYIELAASGLAGSTHVIGCTVQALSHLLVVFKADVDTELLRILLDSTCLLVTFTSRVVMTSSFDLLKVLLVIFDTASLAQFLEKIVTSVAGSADENGNKLKERTRLIFAKLIKKFGYDMLKRVTPTSHQKMLVNVRKRIERTKRHKAKAKEEEESGDETTEAKSKVESIDEMLRDTDSELEEDETGSDTREKKKKKKAVSKKSAQAPGAWIQEGGTEDIVDFMDPSVSKKLLASKPQEEAQKDKGEKDRGFKMAADGRLIICDDAEEQQAGGEEEPADMDDLDELLAAMEGPNKKSRKRKLTTRDEDDDDDDMTYKPGGSGIHRPLSKRTPDPGAEYKSKKARGDVKKKGKPDPFAYVPLQLKSLNRRSKTKGQFKNLVRGAKKGAVKGSKQHGKKRR